MSKVKCLNCYQILESTSRHDFVGCKCYREARAQDKLFREALEEYLAQGIALSPHVAQCAFTKVVGGKGVAVDGGSDYLRIIGAPESFEIIKDIDNE